MNSVLKWILVLSGVVVITWTKPAEIRDHSFGVKSWVPDVAELIGSQRSEPVNIGNQTIAAESSLSWRHNNGEEIGPFTALFLKRMCNSETLVRSQDYSSISYFKKYLLIVIGMEILATVLRQPVGRFPRNGMCGNLLSIPLFALECLQNF